MQDINSIIESNIGLIKTQLRRLNLFRDPDAESIGYEALYNAATTYDEDKGYKFSTYATCCIYNALGSYIRTINKKKQLEVISYNNIAYTEADGAQHEFLDIMTNSISAETDILQQELFDKVNEAFNLSYSRLTNDKHKAIIMAWHEAAYDISNKEIARLVGVSQPYVNQVINTFKYSIRKRLEDYIND